MIASFRGRFSATIAAGTCPKGFPPNLLRPGQRRLAALISAEALADLAAPPGNRLEALHRDRVGQHSIRINDQWRVCFRWVDGRAEDVEIVDYHRGR